MYSKVVVLLDGSNLAEAALPHLEEIAKGGIVKEILLVSVTEPVKGNITRSQAGEYLAENAANMTFYSGGTVTTGLVYSAPSSGLQNYPVTLGKMAKTALDYLVRIADQLAEKGLESRVNVLVGDPAQEIVRFAADQEADLIIMASRGKTGFSRWDLGNVAQKVLRTTNVPVILVKPDADFKETKPKRKGKAN